ncbi:MAG: hypothetical protein KatS3mg087_0055 [Patescibacteria group bacterium]|nr:MAG: hypothetical protein KatS3mg087_0055 [Patescibacteria group bacterium]
MKEKDNLYLVDSNGIVCGPNKFEGEPVEVIVLYRLMMSGFYDEEIVGNGTCYWVFYPSDTPIPGDCFEDIPEEWHDAIRKNLAKRWYIMTISDVGFVYSESFDNEEDFHDCFKRLQQSVEEELEEEE